MDGDPVVEPELDFFSLTFPLPYRVAFIVIIGMYLQISRRMFAFGKHSCKLTISG